MNNQVELANAEEELQRKTVDVERMRGEASSLTQQVEEFSQKIDTMHKRSNWIRKCLNICFRI